MTNQLTDVLIIGAGPAGLMLANSLAKLHVSCRVIDRRENNESYGQADGIQPGTIEIWDSYGIAEALWKDGIQGSYSSHVDKGLQRKALVANITAEDARYPFEVILLPSSIEKALRQSVAMHGVIIEQPWIPRKLEIQTLTEGAFRNFVKVTLSRPDNVNEQMTICANHSWVREQVGICMENMSTVIDWGVLDFTPSGNFPDFAIKNLLESPVYGTLGWIPHPGGGARLYVPFSLATKETDEYIEGDVLSTISNMAKKVMHPYKLEIDNVRWAGKYRGHTHSPNAGQGANVSMRDSHNLGWKLAYVLRGWAKPSLLGTYETEQRKVAEDLIALDKNVVNAMGSSEDSITSYHDAIASQSRFAAGIGVCYKSNLTQENEEFLVPGLRLGERIPPMAITELKTWKPGNLQDLFMFNGLFTLLLLPGSYSGSNSLAHLQLFSEQFEAHPDLKHRLQVYGLLNNVKEDLHYSDVVSAMRLYVSGPNPEKIFTDTGKSWIHILQLF
ncbi:hypothetical protein D9757_013011 [Collybiopsis confluens]|uniref:FAD-binding domain-containing protein n=1 Tax=Collybiopsis confluens TaxID=2823264 RepID=A0A8H5G3J1_9AGAR|nr:hypothetical protein D9757_013011 [Collybiopsis confluens]